MIHGVGTDIVEVERMAERLERMGERWASRILTESELLVYRSIKTKAHFLAKRYAAKEAAVKAMGVAFRDGISLRHLDVKNDESGKPYLVFSGRALELKNELKVGDCHLSLSDEKAYAVAFVVAERQLDNL